MKSNRITPAWFALAVLLLSLASCSPVTLSPSTPTSALLTPTLWPDGTPPASPALTETAPATVMPATPEPTATATENPLAGAPEGTTGKDAEGHWIKPATKADGSPLVDSRGNTVYATWLEFGPNGETMTGWFVNHVIPDPTTGKTYIPIIQEYGSVKEGLPMQFMVKDGLDAKYLQHISGTGIHAFEFMDNFHQVVFNRYKVEHPGIAYTDFWKTIWPDSFSINVTDAQGNSYRVDNKTSFTVVLVDPEDIPNPDFVFGTPGSSGVYYYKTFDDDSHSVTILVASDMPFASYSQQDQMKILLHEIGHVLVFPDLNPALWKADPGKAAQATSLANTALKGDNPYFVLSDTP